MIAQRDGATGTVTSDLFVPRFTTEASRHHNVMDLVGSETRKNSVARLIFGADGLWHFFLGSCCIKRLILFFLSCFWRDMSDRGTDRMSQRQEDLIYKYLNQDQENETSFRKSWRQFSTVVVCQTLASFRQFHFSNSLFLLFFPTLSNSENRLTIILMSGKRQLLFFLPCK